MSQYIFKVNDTEIKHPENWASLSLGYDFDGVKAGAKEIAEILMCDAQSRALFLAQIETVPCFEYVFSILFRCKSSDPYEEIFFTTVPLKDIAYECNGCEMTLSSKRNSIASYLDEIAGDEKCVKTQTDLELFQVQSGGRYYNPDREIITASFISLLDLVNLFAQDVGGSLFTNLTGLVHNESAIYVPAKAIITPDSVPVGDTILTITGEFGQIYEIEIADGSYSTIPEYLTRINQALCCVPDGEIDMSSIELHSRIAYCEIVVNTLTINAYWNFESVTLTVGGSTPSWFTEVIQDQQRSSADIYISPAGLFGSEVCLTWEDLKTLVTQIQGGYIRESYNNEQFQFKPYCSIKEEFPDTSPANIVIDNANNVRKSFNTEWFVNKVEAGYDFRVKDFKTDSSPEEWRWWGKEIEGPIFNLPDNCITFTEPCHGRVFGKMVFSNNTATSEKLVLNAYVDKGNGKQLIDSTTKTVPPNSTEYVIIGDSFPNNSIQDFFPGERICIDWRNESDGSGNSTGSNISATNEAFWVFLCTPCFDSPFLDEDDIYAASEYGRLVDFAGCRGVKSLTIDDKFYAGLGFAISQRVQGLQDYEDTHFITYGNPDGTARQFPKCFYFQDTYTEVCEAYQGQFVSYSYYNAPLQLPSLLKDLLCQIPSTVSILSYKFNISMDANGVITKSKTNIFAQLEGTGAKCIIDFDVCANEYDLIRALSHGAVNIDLCDNTGLSIIKNFDMTLGNTRRGRYRVLI